MIPQDVCFTINDLKQYKKEEKKKKSKNKENKHRCFICLEQNETTDLLQTGNFILSKFSHCRCKGWIHLDCLDKWYRIKNKCPACNTHVLHGEPDYIIHENYNPAIHHYTGIAIIQFLLWFLCANSFLFLVFLILYLNYSLLSHFLVK